MMAALDNFDCGLLYARPILEFEAVFLLLSSIEHDWPFTGVMNSDH